MLLKIWFIYFANILYIICKILIEIQYGNVKVKSFCNMLLYLDVHFSNSFPNIVYKADKLLTVDLNYSSNTWLSLWFLQIRALISI